MAFEFKPKEKPAHAVRRVAREEIAHAIADLTGRNRIRRDKAVHETRKRFKKLRALVRLVRDTVGEKAYRRENITFRDAGRGLSAARDAKVLVNAFDDLMKHFADHVAVDTFRAVRNRLVARRREIDRTAQEQKGGVTAIVASLRKARARIADWDLEDHGWSALSEGMHRTYGAGRDRFAQAEKDPEFGKLHEWRKRVKDLWHQLQLLEPAWPEVLKQAGDEAHALADLLGDDHDLGVLRQTLLGDAEAFGSPQDLETLLGLIDARRAELQQSAVQLGQRVYGEKPKAFVKRMGAYWKALDGGVP